MLRQIGQFQFDSTALMKIIKFLADVNTEKQIVDYLVEKEYDTKWIPDYDCEFPDEELLKLANAEKRWRT